MNSVSGFMSQDSPNIISPHESAEPAASPSMSDMLAGLHNTSGMLVMGPHIAESELMRPTEIGSDAPGKDRGIV